MTSINPNSPKPTPQKAEENEEKKYSGINKTTFVNTTTGQTDTFYHSKYDKNTDGKIFFSELCSDYNLDELIIGEGKSQAEKELKEALNKLKTSPIEYKTMDLNSAEVAHNKAAKFAEEINSLKQAAQQLKAEQLKAEQSNQQQKPNNIKKDFTVWQTSHGAYKELDLEKDIKNDRNLQQMYVAFLQYGDEIMKNGVNPANTSEFSFDLPEGVTKESVDFSSKLLYTSGYNDTSQVGNGEVLTTRYPDATQVNLSFNYEGKTYNMQTIINDVSEIDKKVIIQDNHTGQIKKTDNNTVLVAESDAQTHPYYAGKHGDFNAFIKDDRGIRNLGSSLEEIYDYEEKQTAHAMYQVIEDYASQILANGITHQYTSQNTFGIPEGVTDVKFSSKLLYDSGYNDTTRSRNGEVTTTRYPDGTLVNLSYNYKGKTYDMKISLAEVHTNDKKTIQFDNHSGKIEESTIRKNNTPILFVTETDAQIHSNKVNEYQHITMIRTKTDGYIAITNGRDQMLEECNNTKKGQTICAMHKVIEDYAGQIVANGVGHEYTSKDGYGIPEGVTNLKFSSDLLYNWGNANDEKDKTTQDIHYLTDDNKLRTILYPKGCKVKISFVYENEKYEMQILINELNKGDRKLALDISYEEIGMRVRDHSGLFEKW